MGQYENAEKKKTGLLIPILLIITAAALCVTVWALCFRQTGPMAPDYAPREEEANAETIPGSREQSAESPEGGGSVSLTYSREVTIDLAEEKAELIFANPGRSNQNMVLQLLIRDSLIFQSGTLRSGMQLTTMDLQEGAAAQLREGTYEGLFQVLYYDPVSGEKAIVNTEIPVTVTVR